MTGWWDYLYPPRRSEGGTRRLCGCFRDCVVFGHEVLHPDWTGARRD